MMRLHIRERIAVSHRPQSNIIMLSVTRTLRHVAVLCAVATISTRALSQTSPGEDANKACGPALAKDLIVTDLSETQQFAMLDIIDEATFQQLKSTGTASAGFLGDLLSASGDWSTFQENRRRFFAEHQRSGSRANEEHVLQQVSSPISYEQWGLCIRAFAQQRPGFYLWKAAEKRDVVVVQYLFQAPPLTTRVAVRGSVVHGTATNGASQGQLFPARATLGANEGGTITITRQPGDEVTVTGDAGGFAAPVVTSEFVDATAAPENWFALVHAALPSGDQTIGVDSAVAETPNDADEPCDNTTCSPDGKWRAHVTPLRITPAGSLVARNARYGCSGISKVFLFMRGWITLPPNGDCTHQIWQRIGADGKTAYADVLSWTWPQRVILYADVVQPGAVPRDTTERYAVRPNTTSIFAVPSNATSAAAELRRGAGLSTFQLGQSATDGAATYVSTSVVGALRYYEYRINALTSTPLAAPLARIAAGKTPLSAIPRLTHAQSWYAACESGHGYWEGKRRATYEDALVDARIHDSNSHGGTHTAAILDSPLPPEP